MGNKDFFDEEDKALIQEEYDSLINNLTRCDKEGDRELIEKAFRIANEAHWNMRRKSGEPYIIHPISVARIVNQEIGLGAKSIVTALLHDVVEDTEYTLEEVTRDFGPKIASLIDGLTKISGTYNKESSSSMQAENFRKMLMTLSDDIRVILIKIADRLHNMRTLDSMPEHKKMKVAGETIFLYAPLAHRLGLFAIKSELEDLSFKFRQPQIYEEIASKLKHSEKKFFALINKFALPIIDKLTDSGINFDISGRPKSIFSIWKKMQAKNVPFEEIYDVLAVRIVFESTSDIPEKTQCWNIYSMITDTYLPKPDRLRDWVSRPKPNGYEALHVTVMGPEGKWVEVQIRSRRMDEIAERGYAAHWKYKGDSSQENELDKWIKKIRTMLENPLEDPIEFLDEFKMNLFSSEIMVFTPKGKLISLPKGASALDFAYEIHTEIGNKAIGAKINYKLNPVSAVLMSGDQVEIITSDIAKPEKEWLSFVTTSRAKEAIKDALRTESSNRIKRGMEILENKLKELGVTSNAEVVRKLMQAYDIPNKDELYSGIELGIVDLENLKKIVRKSPGKNVIKYWELKLIGSKKEQKEEVPPKKEKVDTNAPFLLRENVENAEQSYEIAKCCNPIPGDEVTGYRSPEGTIIIHKPKCPVAIRLMSNEGNRIIAVKWAIHKLVSFPARISMSGIDRIGLVNEITNIISSELKVNMSRINISVQEGIFEGTIDVYVHHTKDLNNLMMKISNIRGIDSVKRVEDFSEITT
ncbi:MAG TPA: bifunctional (p)ppGpp synthetase/guanosine-3',5'-bis(diphosphate) 3'-pyrophosphohydrolase [Bacteroidales bacterium]|nr:bifunctional (p)ppGpp synthetase/guanosine-3',5'-bis(diphosphate) 3'-pyrophosphohydrolase [Bacteroidales bacterium]HPF03618.1 bifunctional (p)ppGpp synthetase/guanosine-3',5'-bis(diphosphate) 3'-pyrophosphohydrolase [Bacteroidales bacterium]HPJ58812.1 bifunctional (p)ppGpp synthetase/guanosine-3',5'-bis(diphosphate) 3'-pyrophosphohydrolase [Bacteroidales bacterium]HPR10968.1 bifunctional (p)ppGpp synthetase/guanosine-3',5'-bis(diphosphate) 3'-pyrophosphohydrolase [Bacteroidales bacterium]HRW